MTEPNPFETLRQIAGGYCLSRSLHVVANLAVADKMEETPRTAAELAVSVGAHPEAWAASCDFFPRTACSNLAMASSVTRRRRGCCEPIIRSQCAITYGCSACHPSGRPSGRWSSPYARAFRRGKGHLRRPLGLLRRAPGSERHIQRDHGDQGARANRRRSWRLRLLGVQADWRHRRWARPLVERRA